MIRTATSWLRGWRWQVAAISLVALAAYANIYDVGFIWDGGAFIVDNPYVTHPSLFWSEPPQGLAQDLRWAVHWRPVTFVTFATQTWLHGLLPLGFHVVDLAIHLANALLVWWLVRLLFATPRLRDSRLRDRAGSLGAVAALLFVAHPLQTMAVTYIYQRHTSLVAAFYLASLVCYLLARTTPSRRRAWVALGAATLAAVLAMRTKENSFTLPFVAATLELALFSGPRRRVLWLVPLLATIPIIPALMITHSDAGALESIRYATSIRPGAPRWEYLLSQMGAVLLYLRLFLLPAGQSLLHDLPAPQSWTSAAVLAPLAVHLLLAGGAGYAVWRGLRRASMELALVGGGVLWFYVTLSIESSIIPLHNAVQEYRAYLPSVGLCVAAATLFLSFSQRLADPRARRVAGAGMAVVVILLAAATFARNQVWRDPMTLWQDVALKAPKLPQPHFHMGNQHRIAGRWNDAIAAYERARALDPGNVMVLSNLGNALLLRGNGPRAVVVFQELAAAAPDSASVHFQLGLALRLERRLAEAEPHLRRALELDPDMDQAVLQLVDLLNRRGDPRAAALLARQYLKNHPNDPQVRTALGTAHRVAGDLEHAEAVYREVLATHPDFAAAHKELGVLFLRREEWEQSRAALRRALALEPHNRRARLLLEEVGRRAAKNPP